MPVDAACFGLAGFDRPDDRKILAGWADAARWARHIVPVNDGDLVVAAGTPEGWGIGVIAGTGSIAVGRTAQGRTAGIASLASDVLAACALDPDLTQRLFSSRRCRARARSALPSAIAGLVVGSASPGRGR